MCYEALFVLSQCSVCLIVYSTCIIIFIAQEKVADFYEAFVVMSAMLEDSPNKVNKYY